MQGLEAVECKAIRDEDESIMENWFHEQDADELPPLYQLRDIVTAPF